MPIHFADDPEVDRLVNTDPLALLIAMLLDQQVPLSWAFNGPNRLVERLNRPLDSGYLAALDPETFAAIAATKPAIHRYPRSMAARIQDLCSFLVDNYDGNAAAVWESTSDAQIVSDRLSSLPGFGPEKVKITLAVLVKRFNVHLKGWVELAAPFSDQQPRSVADIGSPEDFERVKAWKKKQKVAGLNKQDSPA